MRRLRPAQAGFTLIELMVVMVIITILASLALPRLRGYLVAGRLEEAKPYLMALSAKQRMYKLDNGKYCCTPASANLDEAILGTQLGVDLTQTGNFCFVFICRDTTKCQSTTATNFIAASETGDPTVDFEIWAILRRSTGTTLTGPSSVQCRMPATKLASTQWAETSTSGKAGREGTAVVLRYPPPPNGRDTVAGNRSIRFDWIEGISTSHAALP